jgi:hypothetical protein
MIHGADMVTANGEDIPVLITANAKRASRLTGSNTPAKADLGPLLNHRRASGPRGTTLKADMTPDDVAVLLGASADAAHFVGEVAGRGGDVKKYLPCWEQFVVVT